MNAGIITNTSVPPQASEHDKRHIIATKRTRSTTLKVSTSVVSVSQQDTLDIM